MLTWDASTLYPAYGELRRCEHYTLCPRVGWGEVEEADLGLAFEVPRRLITRGGWQTAFGHGLQLCGPFYIRFGLLSIGR